MLSVRLASLVQDVEPMRVIGDEVVLDLGYRGSAHMLGRDMTSIRTVSKRHEFRLPLVDVGETGPMALAMRLIVGVIASRPVPLYMPEYVDRDLRTALRDIDGRGTWSIPTMFLSDPGVMARLPRWMKAVSADVPEGWVVGISTLDDFGPISRVEHGGRVAMLARDPMIAGGRI